MIKYGLPLFWGHNKLTADGPFLDLLRAFRHELSQASTLTVVGYSFRDPAHQRLHFTSPDGEITIPRLNGPNSENQSVEYIQDLLRLRNRSSPIEFLPQYACDGLHTLRLAPDLYSKDPRRRPEHRDGSTSSETICTTTPMNHRRCQERTRSLDRRTYLQRSAPCGSMSVHSSCLRNRTCFGTVRSSRRVATATQLSGCVPKKRESLVGDDGHA